MPIPGGAAAVDDPRRALDGAAVGPEHLRGRIPTLFVFDADGRVVGIFYGAPADLHERVEEVLERLDSM